MSKFFVFALTLLFGIFTFSGCLTDKPEAAKKVESKTTVSDEAEKQPVGEKCEKGFIWRDEVGKCITMDEDCKIIYGQYSYADVSEEGEDLCYCENGSDWNRADDTCLKTLCGNGVFDEDGYCNCNDNFFWNADSAGCLSGDDDCADLYGEFSYADGVDEEGYNQCYCKEGYKWNEEDTACVK